MLNRFFRLAYLLFAVLLLVNWSNSLYAQKQSDAEMEYKVKAGFVFNFLKFVSWPNDSVSESESWEIGIIAADGIVDLMREALAGKSVNGRPVRVFEFDPEDKEQSCHVLFICRNLTKESADFTELLREEPVLIVGESQDFARIHGIIGFVKKQQNLRLEINPARAKEAELIISGKLASLAELVEDK